MKTKDTYISPLGFVMTDEEIELRRKQIEEVAAFLLFTDSECNEPTDETDE